jgi:hypothetical protein
MLVAVDLRSGWNVCLNWRVDGGGGGGGGDALSED